MDSPQGGFVEEIDFRELYFGEVVDRGAFGVVSRAQFRGNIVAVKLIETESEKKAFFTELKQLSRVNHPNIVQLYGACTKPPTVCLVMEYAEGGSLYNVLHGERHASLMYTPAHAMSWALQTALGVEYLHGMKPRPLIHRDLKPPNLLLVQGGTVLKICDFGTACDAHTHMTNNKGSAAWMAPEVFEGSNYSEKCDVFSFGIILWEIITRRKPFDEIGGPAFRIMWAVHNGTRPPLIRNCPKPLENMMTKCWSANPVERPCMSEVARVMKRLSQFFHGSEQPLVYPANQDVEGGLPLGSGYATPGSTGGVSQPQTMGTPTHETVRMIGEPVPIVQPTPQSQKPIVIEDDNLRMTRASAPPSLAASRESLLADKGSRSSTPVVELTNKRYSADLSILDESDILAHKPPPAQPAGFVRGHRRTGSHGPPVIPPIDEDLNHFSPSWLQTNTPVRGHRRTGSHGNTPSTDGSIFPLPPQPPHGGLHHSTTAPSRLGAEPKPPEWTPGSTVAPGTQVNITSQLLSSGSDNAALSLAMAAMDYQLQPLAPKPSCAESVSIFEKHCELAKEYLRVQAEISLLTQRKHELLKDATDSTKEMETTSRMQEELKRLAGENEGLVLLHQNLKKQVDMIRNQRRSGVQV